MLGPTKNPQALGGQLWKYIPLGLLIGCMGIGIVIGGTTGAVLAKDSHHFFQINQQTLTGTLDHIPLEMVLEDLTEQLGIEFSGPNNEMKTLISGHFQSEPLPVALSKIIRAWDYALSFDHAGRVSKVFLVKKFAKEKTRPFDPERARDTDQNKIQSPLKVGGNSSNFPALKTDNENPQMEMTLPLGQSGSTTHFPPMILKQPTKTVMGIIPSHPLSQQIPFAFASKPPSIKISPPHKEASREFFEMTR